MTDQNTVARLPYGTDITRLRPLIELPGEATVQPAAGAVQYTVTAGNGNEAVPRRAKSLRFNHWNNCIILCIKY